MGLSGRHLGQFEIRDELGRGGMGTVYRAYDGDAGRDVAIKVLPAQLVHETGFFERFKNEGRVIARLEHPHILPLYSVGEADGYPYLAMRYVGGGSLRDRLNDGTLDRALMLKILPQIADALDEAHRHNVIHRDIKPGNILLDHNDNAYLADFGISKMLEGSAHFTSEGGIVGTPAYMAPEQWRGEQLDARTDVYALACVTFEGLTGKQPYEATNAAAYMTKHLTEPAPSARKTVADLPPALDALLQRAMSKHAAERPASAGAFAQEFAAALRHEDWQPGDGDSPLTLRMDTTQPAKRLSRRLVYVLAGGLALAAVATGIFVISNAHEDIAPTGADTAPTAQNTDLTQSISIVNLSGHSRPSTAVAWSPDSQQLVSSSQDGSLIIWDFASREAIAMLTSDSGWVTAVDWSPDGARIASVSLDGSLTIWDVASEEQHRIPEGHDAAATSVGWSSNSALVATGGEDNVVILWDASSGAKIRTLQGHTGWVTDIAWQPTTLGNQLLASGSRDGTFMLWSPLTGDIIEQTEVGYGPLYSVEWVFTGGRNTTSYLAAGGSDGRVSIWELDSLVSEIDTHMDDTVVALTQWREGGLVAYAFDNLCRVRISEVQSGAYLRELSSCATDAAWSPDGQYIAVAAREGISGGLVKVYDVSFLSSD